MADTVNASIGEHFQTLEDPRIERIKKHLLLDILLIPRSRSQVELPGFFRLGREPPTG